MTEVLEIFTENHLQNMRAEVLAAYEVHLSPKIYLKTGPSCWLGFLVPSLLVTPYLSLLIQSYNFSYFSTPPKTSHFWVLIPPPLFLDRSLLLSRPKPVPTFSNLGLHFSPDDGGSAWLRYIGTFLPDYMASVPEDSILHAQYYLQA
jgi:hypothetical protein